ncbi:MAG: hypothetical protein NVS1B12_17160 [Acidimicrobiales bacterium]
MHPQAVAAHALERCARLPWVDDGIGDQVFASGEEMSAVRALLPDHLVDVPDHGGAVRRWLHESEVVSFRSPFPGVAPRRWSQVAAAALTLGVSGGALLDCEQFRAIEADLLLTGRLRVCDRCAATVQLNGLAVHKATNARCRWIVAAERVNGLWDDGWRDPFSLPGVPLAWSELQARASWRRRVATVRFPRWIAVLVNP